MSSQSHGLSYPLKFYQGVCIALNLIWTASRSVIPPDPIIAVTPHGRALGTENGPRHVQKCPAAVLLGESWVK